MTKQHPVRGSPCGTWHVDAMSSARILNDGLWTCLCPSFDVKLLAKYTLRSLKSSTRNRCASSWHTPVERGPRRCGLTFTDLARNKKPWHHSPRDSGGRNCRFFTQQSSAAEVAQARKAPHDVTNELYERLRSAAFKGSRQEVLNIITALVQEHQEKLSGRLYNALILTHTDPQHGSAAEASRLLQDMLHEGIPVESSTYHALLKVK